ncbi:hypothetical protein WJX74_008572 [Apatococcus lobatus]|uniref:Histone-binding protein RBBP4-like N-terminal domain-containing protein n=2 Tax=Apatococcus TaxID=904362 RepID=A0AAW1TAY8_9CHLO
MATSEQHDRWKSLIPFLYDWFNHHHLTWPSLSCRWGPVVEEKTFKRVRKLYLSERTDGTEANKLITMHASVCKPRVASAEVITGYSEASFSPYVKAESVILHPGEVNKIRECPSHPAIVVTHTDAPQLYVWNVGRQRNRLGDKGNRGKLSEPDLTLLGHTDNAEFALGMANPEPLVASGGKDTKVLVWSLADQMTSLSVQGAKGASLQPNTILEGHADTVEDVVWLKGSEHELASVGDDYAVIVWDSRMPGPATKIAGAHGKEDLHCVDWNPLNPDLLATGAADGSLKVWDRRKLSSASAESPPEALFSCQHHSAPIMRLEWSPTAATCLATGSEDQVINVWDLSRGGAAAPAQGSKRTAANVPPELMFQHCGHHGMVADFQWSPDDPFTFLSVSEDEESATSEGGGTLQMWRMNDMIYRPEAEVLAELEHHKTAILEGKSKAPVQTVTNGTPATVPAVAAAEAPAGPVKQEAPPTPLAPAGINAGMSAVPAPEPAQLPASHAADTAMPDAPA